MSLTRSQVAAEFAQFFADNNLSQVYGSDVSLAQNSKSGRTYATVTFCRARTLDGVLHVYGPSFIQVRWQGAGRELARQGSEVCRSVAEAKAFISQHFV